VEHAATYPTDIPTLHLMLREQQALIESLKSNLPAVSSSNCRDPAPAMRPNRKSSGARSQNTHAQALLHESPTILQSSRMSLILSATGLVDR